MRIKEITEYVRKYVHPDVEKQLKKYEKRATKRTRMGYAPGFISYPYRVRETKEAPPGTYFTKTGNLVKGRLSKAAKAKGARETDPKDKQRSKVPPVTQRNPEEAAGVGIITKQNTTKDVNKKTLSKMMKALRLIK